MFISTVPGTSVQQRSANSRIHDLLRTDGKEEDSKFYTTGYTFKIVMQPLVKYRKSWSCVDTF